MKYIIIILIFVASLAHSQSPNVTIKFRCEEIMYHGDTCQSFYRILVNQYKPLNSDENGYVLSNDTSKFDWDNFDINNPKKQFKEINLFSDSLQSYILKFAYSKQDYVFDNVFEFIITRSKCGINDNMRFYFPVKVSSPFTDIKISPVYFIPGDFNLMNDIQYNYDITSDILYLHLKDDYWIHK
jgi:hypothetical protein